jgi:hypothetical protein
LSDGEATKGMATHKPAGITHEPLKVKLKGMVQGIPKLERAHNVRRDNLIAIGLASNVIAGMETRRDAINIEHPNITRKIGIDRPAETILRPLPVKRKCDHLARGVNPRIGSSSSLGTHRSTIQKLKNPVDLTLDRRLVQLQLPSGVCCSFIGEGGPVPH